MASARVHNAIAKYLKKINNKNSETSFLYQLFEGNLKFMPSKPCKVTLKQLFKENPNFTLSDFFHTAIYVPHITLKLNANIHEFETYAALK